MNKIKDLKKMYKINKTDLAKVLATNQNQISRYERGERELKESQIIELCKHYKVSADWLLGIEEGN
jgi:transcriptional regulator with XRE-family HTH domain